MEQLLIMLIVMILLFAYSSLVFAEVTNALASLPSLKWELLLVSGGVGLSMRGDSQYAQGITG